MLSKSEWNNPPRPQYLSVPVPALILGILGGFLAFQASRVRFRFSDTDLDVVFVEGGDDAALLDVSTSGDNKLQGGGANKW